MTILNLYLCLLFISTGAFAVITYALTSSDDIEKYDFIINVIVWWLVLTVATLPMVGVTLYMLF